MQTNLILFSLALAACSTPHSSVPDTTEFEYEVQAQFQSLIEAAQSLDSTAYFDHFDEQSFTSLNENGTVTHFFDDFRSDYLEGVHSVRAYQKLEFTNIKVTELDPRHAVLINEYKATVQLKDDSIVSFAGAGTQVWQETDGQWRLIHISSSRKQDSLTEYRPWPRNEPKLV